MRGEGRPIVLAGEGRSACREAGLPLHFGMALLFLLVGKELLEARFLDQPEEKPRFEKFLADKQEEARRAEMERQKRLASLKPASVHKDSGPSFSLR